MKTPQPTFKARFYQGLKYYQFTGLEGLPLKHAVFTRLGGVSSGPYASLNLSFEVGDLPEAVETNRRLVKEALGLSVLLSAKQVHDKQAFVLRDPLFEDLEVEDCDLLLTDQAGVGLLIKQADCQALLLVAPEKRALALCHAGWRGLVKGVVEEALRLMRETFGAFPHEIWAAISPSLGPCCAEFRDYPEIFPEEFWSFQTKPGYFDLWQITRTKLLRSGVLPERLLVSPLCTRCEEEFFSYRREGLTGRFATVAALL